MAIIDQRQIAASYVAARRVFNGDDSLGNAVRGLSSEYAMNEGSARNYIYVFQRLMEGETYKRMLSIEATRHFFSGILNDFGPQHLQRAIDATRRHISYLEERGEGAVPGLRAVVSEYDNQLRDQLAIFESRLRTSVVDSLGLSRDDRLHRLRDAPRVPRRIQLVTWQFVRSADVIAEVLVRAEGRCEQCKQPAPFLRRSDGQPYLEVHHLVQLAHGGEDTTENAVALCPNCHRKAHFGLQDT